MSPSNTYFIKASVDPSGLFAVCSYFYDKAGQQPVPAGPLSIAQEAGGCQFGQAQGSDLVLLFSNPGLVNSLYASSDPEVTNDN